MQAFRFAPLNMKVFRFAPLTMKVFRFAPKSKLGAEKSKGCIFSGCKYKLFQRVQNFRVQVKGCLKGANFQGANTSWFQHPSK